MYYEIQDGGGRRPLENNWQLFEVPSHKRI